MMYDIEQLTKTYRKAGATLHAVDAISLTIAEGEFLVVHGASGSGKSTLLLILGGMLSPSSGTVRCNGVDLYALSSAARNRFRRSSVGFIFQQFHLMPYLTAYDNIRTAVALRGGTAPDIRALAERLGIADRLGHRPAELSVGEQQRVAMARTLACEPGIILADEPTGNLDAANRTLIAECLAEEHERGRTVILATHEERLLELGTRTLELDNGRIKEPSVNPVANA